MVKVIFSGTQVTDQAHGALGFLSVHFSGFYAVEDATSTGFKVTYSFPSIPGFPDTGLEQAPDVYSGTGLTYKPISFDGATLNTPFSGMIDEVREDDLNYTSIASGLNLSADDFYRVSATKDNADNFALLKQVFSGDDVLKGGSVRDKMGGFDGDDLLDGRRGNDILFGGKGNDRLIGGAGADKLQGNAGRDLLKGGAGADELDGGRGADRMAGGGGADTFIFGASGRDRILDFQNDIDRVQLDASALGVNAGLSGAQVVDSFGTTINGVQALDFGGGNKLIFNGIADLDLIADDLLIV